MEHMINYFNVEVIDIQMREGLIATEHWPGNLLAVKL